MCVVCLNNYLAAVNFTVNQQATSGPASSMDEQPAPTMAPGGANSQQQPMLPAASQRDGSGLAATPAAAGGGGADVAKPTTTPPPGMKSATGLRGVSVWLSALAGAAVVALLL